jgi:hypothetical protein
MELKSNLFCLLSADKGKVCELILSFCALIRGGRSDPHRAGGWGTGRYGKTLKLWYVALQATYHSFKVCSFDRSNMVVYGEKEKKIVGIYFIFPFKNLLRRTSLSDVHINTHGVVHRRDRLSQNYFIPNMPMENNFLCSFRPTGGTDTNLLFLFLNSFGSEKRIYACY